jgi:hypothetical protein
MELQTNTGEIFKAGKARHDDHDCEFEIVEGFKVIAFSGVMQVLSNDCRLLNLAVTSKQILEDCETAENSVSYRDVIKFQYETFNVMKSEMWDQVKRIKAIKLYPGKVITSGKEINKQEIVGGIQIVYELKNLEEYENGIVGIKCMNYDQEPQILEMRDNEYITSISGTGKDYIQTLTIETNFYRKLKQGNIKKEIDASQSS